MKKDGFKEHLNTSAARSDVLHELTPEESSCLKQQLLEMYRDVAEVCKKHDLLLLLCGGTALGCVRHKGFIPWDDDLDLMMTRQDYEKFTKIFQKELGDRYLLNAPNYSDNPKARFPKIVKKGSVFKEITDYKGNYPCGIFLDFFILDGIPENRFVRKVKGIGCNALMFLSTCAYWYEQRNPAMFKLAERTPESERDLKKRLRIGKICSRLMPASKWFNKVDKAIQYNGKTELLGLPTGRKHYFGEIFRREQYTRVVKGVFENTEANLPGDYDAYLTNLYGDYMQLPPAEKRERHFVVEYKA